MSGQPHDPNAVGDVPVPDIEPAAPSSDAATIRLTEETTEGPGAYPYFRAQTFIRGQRVHSCAAVQREGALASAFFHLVARWMVEQHLPKTTDSEE